MRPVRDWLNHWEEKHFVGREADLRKMEATLNGLGWRMLHLYGFRGIGKTSLLRQYCRVQENVVCYRLQLVRRSDDGHNLAAGWAVRLERATEGEATIPNGETGVNCVMELERLPEQLSSLCKNAGRAVLLLDSFETWKPLYNWLRDSLFPELPERVKVLTASRYQLDGSWTQDGKWSLLTEQLEIRPFDQIESFQYISTYGIDDFNTGHYLAKFALGVPYALHRLCEDTVQSGFEYVASTYYQRQFYDTMVRYLLEGLEMSDEELEYLDASCLLWNFDKDVLSFLLQKVISTHAFRQFCRQPVIESTSAGWRVHPALRYWCRKEFAYRAPEQYASMRQMALRYVMDRLAANPTVEKRLPYLNLLHLIENDVLHMYAFQESPELYIIRPLRKDELGLARDMFVSFHEQVPAYLQDHTHQENYLETYWELTPDTFHGFYREGKLAMFVSMLPLTPRIRSELLKNPIYSTYVKQTEPEDQDTLMWIASFQPEYSANAIGRVFLYGFTQLAGRGRLVVMSPFLEAHQLTDSLGFERLEWADYTAENGLVYKAHRLDLRSLTALAALLSKEKEANAPAPEIRLSEEEKFALVKGILVHFSDFEQIPEIVGSCAYLRGRCHSRQELSAAGDAVREFISGTLEAWQEKKGIYSVYGEILRSCYIQKAGTHETVAERLNLSLSTYYRSLKKGIAALSEAYAIRFSRDSAPSQ